MTVQLIQPNPNVACSPGLCLEYVQNAFDIKPKYTTAIDSWNNSRYKHEDDRFPDGVWIPIWFTDTQNAYGHVALRQPDGSIWSASSPLDIKPIYFDSLSALENYHRGKLRYLGWTEDVEGTLVITMNGVEEVSSISHLPAAIAGSNTNGNRIFPEFGGQGGVSHT